MKLLEKRLPDVKNLRVEGMALAPTSKQHVSFGARRAIEDLYGEDLLGGYVPKTVTAEDLEAADLVLVMDRDLLNKRMPKGPRLPSNKTYVFKEFFGLQGDIKDPWPDGKDQETLSRYRQRADEIKTTLETDFDRLLDALGLGGQEKEQLEPGSTSARL